MVGDVLRVGDRERLDVSLLEQSVGRQIDEMQSLRKSERSFFPLLVVGANTSGHASEPSVEV